MISLIWDLTHKAHRGTGGGVPGRTGEGHGVVEGQALAVCVTEAWKGRVGWLLGRSSCLGMNRMSGK